MDPILLISKYVNYKQLSRVFSQQDDGQVGEVGTLFYLKNRDLSGSVLHNMLVEV